MAAGESIGQIEYDWPFIEDTVTVAWNKSSYRPEGYYTRILGEEKKSDTNPLNQNPKKQQPDQPPTMHAVLHPSARDSLSDMTITCERLNDDGAVCGESSLFTIAEQLRYKTLGFEILPKFCKKHRGVKPFAAPKCAASSSCNL